MKVEYKSKLHGKFEGWSPTTVYKLKNGTKWMLTFSKFSNKNLSSPKVQIHREGNDYYMKIDSIDKMEKVRRVE